MSTEISGTERSTALTVFARSAIRAAVEGAGTGSPVATIRRIDAGNNHAYRVDRRDGTAQFLKVGTRFPERFPTEPATVSFLRRETDLPVPRVHATGEAPLGYPFAVYEFVPGAGVGSVADLPSASAEAVCREAGRHLDSLHGVTFPEFGGLGADGDALTVTDPRPYRQTLRDSLDRQLSGLDGSPFDGRREALAERGSELIDRVDPDGVRPALVHGDYRPANLRIDPAADPATVAVLDWERPTAFDPLWDAVMARALLADGHATGSAARESLGSAFWEAYGDDGAGTARRECYELLARIRLARHLETEMRDEPADAVAARVRQHHAAFDDLLAAGATF